MQYKQEISRLYNLSDESQGFPDQKIAELEGRLGIKLPNALKNYYVTLGKHENLNYAYNRLLLPDDEVGFSKDRYLLFFEEYQAVVSWGIKETDLQYENPPVWGNSGTDDEPDWYLEADTTEKFLLLMAIYNGTLGGLPYNANCLEPIDSEIVKMIKQNWTFVPDVSYDRQQVYTDDFYEVISLSFDEGENCTGVFIGTSDQERFDGLLDRIAIDWSYTSYEDEDWDEEE